VLAAIQRSRRQSRKSMFLQNERNLLSVQEVDVHLSKQHTAFCVKLQLRFAGRKISTNWALEPPCVRHKNPCGEIANSRIPPQGLFKLARRSLAVVSEFHVTRVRLVSGTQRQPRSLGMLLIEDFGKKSTSVNVDKVYSSASFAWRTYSCARCEEHRLASVLNNGRVYV